MDATERELAVLEHIEQHNTVNQRELARAIGMSLGITNAVLKRLAEKGLLLIKKINNRNILYAVTPMGFDAIAKRSYRYFKRTLNNIVKYKREIEALVEEIKTTGFEEIVLVGLSDLEFIVEWACQKKRIRMSRDDVTGNVFYLYSERYIPDYDESLQPQNRVFLQDILIDDELIRSVKRTGPMNIEESESGENDE